MSALPIFFSTSSNVWKSVLYTRGIFQTHRLSNFVCVFQILSHRSRFLPSRIDRIVDALSHRRNTNLFYNLRRGKKKERERESACVHIQNFWVRRRKRAKKMMRKERKIILLLLLLPPPMMKMMMRYKEKRSPLP